MTGPKTNAVTVTLPSDLEIRLTRAFDAPRRLVFEALTRPEHVRRWWGLRATTMTVCDIDFKPGGAWRYVLRGHDGREDGFRGVYREIVPPDRLVHTFVYEPMPQYEAVITVELAEAGGRTTLTETVRHQTKEARDGHLQSGMEEGSRQTFERLEELLPTLQ
jgi:uncharacterized protein YndB with AHSA1/START domain